MQRSSFFWRFIALVFFLNSYIFTSASSFAKAPLVQHGGHFVDAHGRIVILRGFNVSSSGKVPDHNYRAFWKEEHFAQLQSLGANVIRFVFNWEAFEPIQGEYNSDYLDYVLWVVESAKKYGLMVIVDIHQDGYSRFAMSGCGEGFPRWTLPPYVKQMVPKNDESCMKWSFKLLSPWMAPLFNDFYIDKFQTATAYRKMLTKLAHALNGHDNVIGFDMLNEPLGDMKLLSDFYDKAQQTIRSEFPDALVFIAPHFLSGTGLIKTSLPQPRFKQYVYAPHMYTISLSIFKAWTGIPPKYLLNKLMREANRLKSPLFIGEFGAAAGAGWVGSYIDRFYDDLDSLFASGTQWEFNPRWSPIHKDLWNREDFSIIDDHAQLRSNFKPRPHLRAISGQPVSYQSTVRRGRVPQGVAMEIVWNHQPLLGTTDIFYPNLKENAADLELTISEGASCQKLVEQNLIRCSHDYARRLTLKLRQKVLKF
jgi:endoglycosylceramidase